MVSAILYQVRAPFLKALSYHTDSGWVNLHALVYDIASVYLEKQVNVATFSPSVTYYCTVGADTAFSLALLLVACSLSCLFSIQVLNALDNDPLLDNIHFPSTPAELSKHSKLLSRDGENPLYGCVSAIDGIALRIRRPRVTEVPNPSSYWTRKGIFAVNVQAAVEADYKVQFLSKVTAGSLHDSMAFSASGLEELLDGVDGLPRGKWVPGDDADAARARFLTPWRRNNLSWEKDSYNYHHSSSRTVIELVFGQIVSRWCIWWRAILFCVYHAYLITRFPWAGQRLMLL